jgi:trypsin
MPRRRFLLPVAALLALALPAPASAIVNGTAAHQGDNPAQGYLGINTDGDDTFERTCGGTLVGSRQFLTAARCAVNDVSGIPLTASSFTVRLGDVDLATDPPDEYAVTDNDVHADYDKATGVNDVAMLTLARPADYEPMRVVDDSEDDLWKPGTVARILGWGEISQGGNTSNVLLKGDVSIFTNAVCSAANASFDPAAMVCAAGTAATGSKEPCLSDSGSPLLAPDGAFFALAGVFSGASCSTPDAPGIYARVGDGGPDGLNGWVHDRTPEADFTFNHAPRANEPVTLTSTSRHPQGASYFTTVRWNFDDDSFFDDAAGQSVVHTFPIEGRQVVGIEASRAGGDKATAYFAFDVGPDPNAVPPALGQRPGATPPPPATTPRPAAPRLATISAVKRPKVRRGHFRIRVKFAKTAPRGTAVIEVFRGKRIIGIARTRVRRGATKRVNVKLTTTGKRLLRRSATKRLKVRVRVRVGRRALRSKTLTIRR